MSRPQCILLVCRDSLKAWSYKRFFQRKGKVVLDFEDGGEALRFLTIVEGVFSGVVFDGSLGEADAFSKLFKEVSSIPLLVVSGKKDSVRIFSTLSDKPVFS